MSRYPAVSIQCLALAVFVVWSLSGSAYGLQGEKPEMEISDEAMEIHMSGMLFDGHNDLPWTMRASAGSSFDQVDISQPTEFHTDIPRLRAGGLKAQFWSVFVPASTDMTGNATVQTFEQIRLVHDMCERYPDVFEMADTAADVRRIVGEGKIASMIGVEGGHSIQNSLQTLRQLYDDGARYMTLTHSKTLAWADSATDEAKNNGLSPFGKEVVREMNKIGMLVDLSHVSEKCMLDALEVTRAPVIFSHSSARAICDHPRNVSDEVLKLTAENGGVVMVNFMSGYIVPTAELEANEDARGDYKIVCDHIEHIIKVAGVDHVGIGSDYDGVSSLPVGLDDVSYYPNITQEMLNRGYDREQIHKILGENVLRVLERAEQVAAEMKAEKIAAAETKTYFKIKVSAGDRDRLNEVVTALVDPGDFDPGANPVATNLGTLEVERENLVEKVGADHPSVKAISVRIEELSRDLESGPQNFVTLATKDGTRILAQLSPPSIGMEAADGMQQLTFVLDSLNAGESLELSAIDSGLNSNRQFKWHDDRYGTAGLQYNEIPVMTYMYEPLDDSSEERREETYKVYHHVYTPPAANGAPTNRLMTKGPGGLFPHHRGLFYGFNRVSYEVDGEKKSADTWHCNNGESQTHEKTILQVGGPVIGRDVNVIYWRGQDGQPIANELREMTVSMAGGRTIIDFVSSLDSVVGNVRLDGDPQHAGFQFRASQDVPDKTQAETYYIRPDGIGEPGVFRNWSAKDDETEMNKQHINLLWNALSIVLPVAFEWRGEQISQDARYTVGYLDHPDNPKPSRYSERDYGRFGSYFEYDLEEGQPLVIRYRVVLMEDGREVAELQELSDSFLNPVTVEQVE